MGPMRTAWPFLLCLGVAQAGDPIADHDKAHGAPELPRLGTIGDRPPPETTLVVHVHRDGAILIDGKEVSLKEFSAKLGRLRAAQKEPAVLLRADARLPWRAVQLLRIACLESRIDRVFHAVLPETGDEEGAFLWPPRDGGGDSATRVAILQGARNGTPEQLYWAAREAEVRDVNLKTAFFVPAGFVLRAVDALFRAGVSRVSQQGTAIPRFTDDEGDLKFLARVILEQGASEENAIYVTHTPLGEGKTDPMPAAERIRGAFAGYAVPARADEEPESKDGPSTGPVANRGRPTAGVELGLKWLADHQDLDGKWDCDGFPGHDPDDDKCDGTGAAPYDVGVTGLAILAFLGAGYTDRKPSENPYADTVRRGLGYLIASQDEEGTFGPSTTPRASYNHVIAAVALCEAYWMTRNPRYRTPAQKGLDRIARARNPGKAWRYAPRGGDNDTSMTAWCVLALRAGKYANLEIDPDALAGARAWIDSMTGPDGRVGYAALGGLPDRPVGAAARWPPERSQSMTAAGILARVLLGEHPRESEVIGKGVKLCLDQPPVWNPDTGTIDMTYWYWGTLALFQYGGRPWDVWNKRMHDAIVLHQHPKGSGSRTGSWDPLDPWGAEGGRVYSTALMMMCLEVYYRY